MSAGAGTSDASAGCSPTAAAIAAAVASLAGGPLAEEALAAHVRPLFGRVLAADAQRVYLANHSLGRPLDATADDVGEALALWYRALGDAWSEWLAEVAAFRARLGELLHAPRSDCVVPRASAGQGLRAVLNTWDRRIRVVATRGEFDSLDVILRHYARRGRIELDLVAADDEGRFDVEAIGDAVDRGCDLVVVSQVMFSTGQAIPSLPSLAARAHAVGARILVDVYHSLGVLDVDVQALDVDFAVGGSYKYLRGGPGACFLYVHPRWLDAGLTTLDIGWFAKRSPFDYARPDPPLLAEGGDAFLESTPPVLAFYQARAGQLLALALGTARVREYSLRQQRALVAALSRRGVAATGGTPDQGAFVVVRRDDAVELSRRLRDDHVVCDARGDRLRLCPDILTTTEEIELAAEALGRLAHCRAA